MAAPVIANWVVLAPGVPKRLHFVDHRIASRQVTDPIFEAPKTVLTLLFRVDREDGDPSARRGGDGSTGLWPRL